MTTPNKPGEAMNPAGGLAGQALNALPPDIQALLKPGKTSERIQSAIAWAARQDLRVLQMHRALDPSIQNFADVQRATLANKDKVARAIARRYRHRAALTGAVTSLPGGLWAIVAAGADVQLTATYSVRMAAMIAQAYGYDTTALEEQAHLADVLALVAGIDSLRGVGTWLTREGLLHVLPEILPKLLLKLSVELTEEQAAKLVGRLIPGIGAVVGGGIDYTFLRAAGERAMAYYHNRWLEDNGFLPPGTSVQSLPTGGKKALPAPAAVPAAAAAAAAGTNAPRIVEGSIVSPSQEAGRSASYPRPALPAPSGAYKPMPMPAKRQHSPERFAVYLAIFAVVALGITIAACGALILIVQQALSTPR